jgi:hypothetical protein
VGVGAGVSVGGEVGVGLGKMGVGVGFGAFCLHPTIHSPNKPSIMIRMVRRKESVFNRYSPIETYRYFTTGVFLLFSCIIKV